MDIRSPIVNSPRTEAPPANAKARGAPSNPESSPSPIQGTAGESVTLTQTAKTLSAATGAAQEAPFDSARVAGIKAAIAEGRYPIDNQRLADNMLRLEGMLS